MWDEEDNNPYGSFHQDSDQRPPSYHTDTHDETPPSGQTSPQRDPAFYSRRQEAEVSEGEEDAIRASRGERKRGQYDGRVQQILYENPELEILIIEAAKSAGGWIEYKIRVGDVECPRRYSEFASLRNALVSLHPTLVIPPIPEKQTMADYAAKPTKAKEDKHMIEQRKRMLAVFLNRCRRMKDVMDDGVFWRFLDPHSTWNEVLHAHPIASIPKSNLKAPPLNPANPTPAHQWLPVPSSSAKLKSGVSSTSAGTPIVASEYASMPSVAAHTTPGPQIFGRFPVNAEKLSENDLDPYFISFEASTKELEHLLQGSIDKVNRRTLEHLSKLSADLAELGARYNGFSLSEHNSRVAAAIERTGQAVDQSYMHTEELSGNLGASFVEPMRENAQFAGVVRNVLRYRVLKRVQQEMTRDQLESKKAMLNQLERSEQESKRIDAYMTGSMAHSNSLPYRNGNGPPVSQPTTLPTPRQSTEETQSIDSDFPPTHEGHAPASPHSAFQGPPDNQTPYSPPNPNHKKSASGNFVTNKLFGSIRHTLNGFTDSDPERTRRDQMGKTKDSLVQLEQALVVSEKDVKDATQGVMRDLKRFQREKEADLNRYMVSYARCHIEWARQNLREWEQAKAEVDKINAP